MAEPSPSAAQRVAAVATLAAGALALVLLVVGVASSWWAALLAIVGSLLLVVAGWYAVARRGGQRRLAIGCAIGGGALLVVGVVAMDVSFARAATIVVLAAASVATSRVALRAAAPEASEHAPRARAPVLIINPRSGGGKAEQHRLVDECVARGIEPIVLGPGDDLVALAEGAIARGADVIGMAGGDGSQALVAATASAHDVPMFVVPSGTRNHFALDLGLDREDVVGALDACVDAVERRIDLATVNGRVFVNNASLGVYATVVQSPEYRDAKRQTVTAMLPELIGPDSSAQDLRFTGPDGEQHETAHAILVSNDPYRLHRVVARRGRRKRMDLGLLGIVTARVTSAGEASRFVALVLTGHGRRFPGWLDWSAPGFRIDSADAVEIALDGEAMRLDPPLEFASAPRVLRVRLPIAAVTRTPVASVADVLSSSTMRDLAAVAAGRSPRATP